MQDQYLDPNSGAVIFPPSPVQRLRKDLERMQNVLRYLVSVLPPDTEIPEYIVEALK